MGWNAWSIWVKVTYNQKPYRKSLMQIFGSNVIASPSDTTASGRKILAKNPDSPGSLGIAISEAVEDAAKRDDTNYALGSVLNHVCIHQSIIGLEAKAQMAMAGEYPDVVIGCCGGGSNFSGMAFPFAHDKFANGSKVRLLAVEPISCPTLTRGIYEYDYGDVVGLAPIVKMYTLGTYFMPPSIHAGGLRYHGDSPLLSKLVKDGIIDAIALGQTAIFKGAIPFARSEGIIPAPESAHAVQAAIQEAIAAREAGQSKTILFNLSGHGMLDLPSYDLFLGGKLEDYALPEEDLAESLKKLPKIE